MPSELNAEIHHRIEERLALLGFFDKQNTPPHALMEAKNEAEQWAKEHYPDTYKIALLMK